MGNNNSVEFTQKMAIGNEWGEGETNGHCHAFLRTADKWKLAELNNELERRGIRAADLQVSRNMDKAVSYVTKEDQNGILLHIDLEKAHINWKIMNYVMRHENINMLDYFPRNLSMNYMKKFREIHARYWSEMLGTDDWELASRWSTQNNELLLQAISNSDKKGIYIWGDAGGGKSTTAFRAMNVSHYQFIDSSNFPMTSFAGHTDILYDDSTDEGWVKHRKLILQITSGYSFPVEVKHGDCKVCRLKGKFIMTSNEAPPEDEGFKRRFKVFNVFRINNNEFDFE